VIWIFFNNRTTRRKYEELRAMARAWPDDDDADWPPPEYFSYFELCERPKPRPPLPLEKRFALYLGSRDIPWETHSLFSSY